MFRTPVFALFFGNTTEAERSVSAHSPIAMTLFRCASEFGRISLLRGYHVDV